MRYFNVLIILIVGVVACSTTSTRKRSVRPSSYVITAEEIENTSASNAFEAVQLLRPQLLHQQSYRTNVSITQGQQTAIVYLDEVRYGTFESLRSISTFSIAEIRYIKPNEATLRFGTDHAGGAFMVKSK